MSGKEDEIKNMFKEISEANLPDTKTTFMVSVPFSFVRMLNDMAQKVVKGQISNSDFFIELNNMEQAIEFFKNLTIVEDR